MRQAPLIYSMPINIPQGLNSGNRSNMIFKTPTKGMERNIPEIPHKAPSK